MTELPTVKCQDCGLLALRHARQNTVPDVPATKEIRHSGQPPADCYSWPCCHVAAFDLQSERDAIPNQRGDTGRFLDVITAARVCGNFVPNTEGMTPAEHRVAADAARREREGKMNAIELLRVQHELMERAADKQRKWQEQQDEKHGRSETRRWLLAGVGGVVVAVASFFGGRHFAEQDRIAAEQRAAQKTTKTE